MIRYGVSPIAWANDDMPELGGDTPLETILAEIKVIGFEGVELGGKFPRDPALLKPIMARHGLEIVGGWYSANLLTRSAECEIEALQPHLALLEEMGSEVFILAETSNAVHGDRASSLAASPRLDAGDWARFAARLSTVAGYITARGLRFAYHHHLGTVVETADDLQRFLDLTTDDVGLVLDTGHALYGGIDPTQIVRSHPQRIAHVHCKDVRANRHAHFRKEGRSFLDGVLGGMFTAPGDGDFAYAPFLRALSDIGYSGWIIVEAEQDPALANPREYSQLGLDTLKRLAQTVELV